MTKAEERKTINRAKAQERRACIKECRLVACQWSGPDWQKAVAECIKAILSRNTP
jgi:hypothetical protein